MEDGLKGTPETTSDERREELDARFRQHDPGNIEATKPEAVGPDGGSGPFGSDMAHMQGGTRHGDETGDLKGSPYSTGSRATDGRSTTPADPRTGFDHDSEIAREDNLRNNEGE